MQYGLSAQRVIRVIRSYERMEVGVAKNTVAVMQPLSVKKDKEGKKKWSQEIWVMYQRRRASISKSQFPISKQIQNSKLKTQKMGEKKNELMEKIKNELGGGEQLKIISVWRYPGVSPKNNPIPQEILDELDDLI
ncbi:MAG: hypothetical protein UR60_C0017G0024 [Candidatus Moranbacteria bacterium GW2011_GWF2_34_56]|nr:MAG: hypothetical protein UR60_C0017G0024 [Candidatus Moranbacteria bacterium GW2011_GWF2_34_56]